MALASARMPYLFQLRHWQSQTGTRAATGPPCLYQLPRCLLCEAIYNAEKDVAKWIRGLSALSDLF